MDGLIGSYGGVSDEEEEVMEYEPASVDENDENSNENGDNWNGALFNSYFKIESFVNTRKYSLSVH